MSIDALFGLPRREKAGKSYRNSLHGHLWFVDQPLVDKYVSKSTKPSTKNEQGVVQYVCTCVQ